MSNAISIQEILNAAFDQTNNRINTGVSISANMEVANNDGGDFRVSAVQDGAAALNVSAKSNDAALLRVSAHDAGYAYNNITTSAQTAVKSGAGILGLVAINTTLVSAVRGYDNTVSGGSTLFTIAASTAPTSIRYEARFATGLVVSSGAAADNITIMYN